MSRKKIHTALIMHAGWEMDNEVWVTEDSEGNRFLMATNHGSDCSMSANEIDRHILKAQKSIDELTKAKELVYGQCKPV